MTPAIAGINDATAWIIPAAVVVAIFGVIGFGLMLGFAQRVRSQLATELTRELGEQAKRQKIEVQQPIIVSPQTEFATREEHQKLAAKVDEGHRALVDKLDEELGRERSSRKRIHEEVAVIQGDLKAIKATNESQSVLLNEVKQDGKATASKVDTMIGETKALNQQLQQVTLALQNSR